MRYFGSWLLITCQKYQRHRSVFWATGSISGVPTSAWCYRSVGVLFKARWCPARPHTPARKGGGDTGPWCSLFHTNACRRPSSLVQVGASYRVSHMQQMLWRDNSSPDCRCFKSFMVIISSFAKHVVLWAEKCEL